jgi:hypothetical protein
MSTELKGILELHVGTIRRPKYRVFDVYDNPDFDLVTVDAATFTLTREDSGEQITAGACAVDNEDSDRSGNEIKTIQPTLDLRQTELDEDETLAVMDFHLTLSNGEDDHVMQNCKIKNYARRF